MKHRMMIGLLVLLLLAACGGTAAPSSTGSSAVSQGKAEESRDGSTGGADAALPPAASPAASAAQEPGGAAAGGSSESAGDDLVAARNAQGQFNRLVIRTGTLSLVVENVDSAEAQIRQIAESRAGYVLGSQVNGDGDLRRASISIKIPATRFDEAMAAIAKLALEVETQDVQGQDVTDEYVDLESRLRNLRAVEARLLDFLNQAQKVEEALLVNQQLTEIQGQIEQAEGRIAYLKESAAYSTITVSLRGQPVVEIAADRSWSPGATARNAANGLIAFGQVVADILIVFAVWFPIWLPALIVGLWLWRRSRPTPQPTPPPASQPAPQSTPQP